MGTVRASQWSSQVVPSVQEMIKEKVITTLPPRYAWPDQDKIEVVEDEDINNKIPVIDMKRLCSATDMDSEIEKLDLACKEWGFFQLVNHGVDSSFLEKFKSELQDFFNLPMEEKKKFWQTSNDVQGFGQVFVFSEESKLDWADMYYMIMHPVRSRKPHLFPKLPLPFRDTLETYSAQVKSIAKILHAKMATALEVKPEEMEELFDDDMAQSMRINYYPPCPEPDQAIGFRPHSDSGGLTILLQVHDVEGLQIKKDGKYCSSLVKPLPNAFIVNVGDIIEIITNGIYPSIEHRAVVNSTEERMSIATFHSPGPTKTFGPMRTLVERQKVANFKTVTYKQYFDRFFAHAIDGKANIEAMRL